MSKDAEDSKTKQKEEDVYQAALHQVEQRNPFILVYISGMEDDKNGLTAHVGSALYFGKEIIDRSDQDKRANVAMHLYHTMLTTLSEAPTIIKMGLMANIVSKDKKNGGSQ